MATTEKLKIRLRSPWKRRFETELAVFSVDIRTEDADALLCDWAPDPELFTFPGRKAWYCCEPECQFKLMGQGDWPEIRELLQPHEFIHHAHPEERFRVPHATHFQKLETNTAIERKERAIAVVSNYGGRPWKRHAQIHDRNRFITNGNVDLYGRDGWRRYQKKWYSWPQAPGNYKGEIPGDWPAVQKRQLLAEYKVAICMENMNEPHYFTEKFVEAVAAGCIPVYRADPTISKTILKGAAWIDPADHGDCPESTIQKALESSHSDFLHQNTEWLKGANVRGTNASAIYDRLAFILSGA